MNAFSYMKKKGISNGLKYTYKAVTQKCQRIPKKWPPVLKIPNACEIEVAGNEETLKKIIAQIGPVAGVMAVTDGFVNYDSGVFYDEDCVEASPNHAIVSF
jgi:Papain family cysteine protease